MPSLKSPRKKSPLKKARAAASPAKKSATKSSARGDLAPERIAAILKALDEAYPEAVCALTHRSPWELLVATILSAQCTDVRVNMVTPALFAKYPNAQEVDIDSNLTEASATTLVTTYFNELKKVAEVYTVEYDGILRPEDCKTSIPSYTLTDTQYGTDTRTFKLARFETDYLNNKTKVTIRG